MDPCHCLLCNEDISGIITTDGQFETCSCTNIIAKLLHYPNSFGGLMTQIKSEVDVDSWDVFNNTALFFCTLCKNRLDNVGLLLAQLEELHRQVTEFQTQLLRQTEDVLRSHQHGSEDSSLLVGARQHLVNELVSCLGIVLMPTATATPTAPEAEVQENTPAKASEVNVGRSRPRRAKNRTASTAATVEIHVKQEPPELPVDCEDEGARIPDSPAADTGNIGALNSSSEESGNESEDNGGSDSDEWVPPPEPKSHKRKSQSNQNYIDNYAEAVKARFTDKHVEHASGFPVLPPDSAASPTKYPKWHLCTVPSCNLRFRSKAALRTHCIKTHPETNTPAFQCQHCSFSCTTQARLHAHIRSQHKKKEARQQSATECTVPGCKYQTWSAKRMRIHVEGKHEGKHNFFCPHCGKGFYLQKSLGKHVLTHGEKSFTCSTCGKRYLTKYKLQDHEKREHETARPFVCELCGFRFPTKDNLYSHRLTWHKGGSERIGVQPYRKGRYNADT